MLSIIICSRHEDISSEQRNNICSTVGCEHEIIVIDNSSNSYSIFTAYNEGIRQANGNMLCFMHEDVFMHSHDWGKEIEKTFAKNPNCGCLGIAGGHILPNHPCYWSDIDIISCNYFQLHKGKLEKIVRDRNFNSEGFANVAVADGCWMCIPKTLFDERKIRFDNDTYKGFHMYDMDICMQILSIDMEVLVTQNILIEHRSNIYTSKNEQFYQEQPIWFNKWKHKLPLIVGLDNNLLIDGIEQGVKHAEQIAYEHGTFITRQTLSYRLGNTLLQPLVWIKRILKKG